MYAFTIDGNVCTEEEFFKQAPAYLINCDLDRRIRVLRALRKDYIERGMRIDYIDLMMARLLAKAGIEI